MSSKKRFKPSAQIPDVEFDSEDVSDSEEEYGEEERRLLEKARKTRMPEKLNGVEQVYSLGDDNEEEEDGELDSMGSDMEEAPADDGLPDERAWGKKKKAFYSTDYVDQDYSTASRKDQADAQLEEQEARNIQKRLADQLDDADFGLDLFKVAADESEKSSERTEIVKSDLTKLGKRDKLALVHKESPEFPILVLDFKERMTEAKDVLAPFLELVDAGLCADCPAVHFIRAKYHLILNYCININFYIILKAKRLPVNSHPVIKRMAQYRQLLKQLESGEGDLLTQVEEILEDHRSGKALEKAQKNISTNEKSRETKLSKDSDVKDANPEKSMDEEPEEENSAAESDEKCENEQEIAAMEEDEKRAITYQIAKNKGLTPHRKKELRNPRVKHRTKYRKAIIRRKGAVRAVRSEVRRYDGEMSGIKAGVKKSIKLK